jgi:glycine C-acetyltransferase
MGGSGLSQKVAANTARFRQGMTSAGFKILGENHPICPVFLEDAKLASTMAERMLSKTCPNNQKSRVNPSRGLLTGQGIYVIGFSYPVVPKGKARIRVQISAAHSFDDIDRTIEAFISVGRELGVIH